MVKNSRCAGHPEERTSCSNYVPGSSTTTSPTTSTAGTPTSPTPPITRSWPRSLPHFVPLSSSGCLWHGNTFRAHQVLSWLEDDLDSEDPEEAQRKLAKYLKELARYIQTNTAWILLHRNEVSVRRLRGQARLIGA